MESPSAEITNHLTKTPEPTEIALASVTSPDQNDPTLDGQGRSSGNNLLIGSILLAAGGLLLILMGWLFNKSKDSNTENDIHKNE